MKENIACFGDSLIYGFPYNTDGSWLKVVNDNSNNVNCINYGECGFTCDDIYDKMKSFYLPENVRHILVLGGANDILQERPIKDIISDLANIANWCADRRFALCFILPFLTAYPNYNEKLSLLRKEILGSTLSKNFILDLQQAVWQNAKIDIDAYFDGIHPTEATYAKIGFYAISFLDKWIERSREL